MTCRYTEGCSASLDMKRVIRPMVRCHLTPVGTAVIIRGVGDGKSWRGCGAGLVHCWWQCGLLHPLQRTVWRIRDWVAMCQVAYFWMYVRMKQNHYPKRLSAPPCSLQCCLWCPGHRGSLGIHWQMDEWKGCRVCRWWHTV